MAESSVSGVSAHRPVQHAQPIRHEEKRDAPPVKDKETRPPQEHHHHTKKHKVDIKA